MKDKILAAIKAKFPAINLSKARLAAIAAIIEKRVIDDESKIDASLDELNSFTPLADIAKQDDTVRDLQAKLKAVQNPKDKDDKNDKDDKPDPPALPDDTPAYVKTMMESMNKLTATVAQLQSEKSQTSMRQKVTEKLKEVPASYWGKRAIPEKEEDIENFVTEVTTDYTAFKQELTEQGLSVLGQPRSGQQQQSGGKEKEVSPEIKAFAEKQAKQSANGQQVKP